MNDPAAHSQPSLLAEKALSFNLMPCAGLDGTWLDAAQHGRLCHAAAASPDAEPKLGQYLLDTFEIADRYWCDFSAPRTRLALLDRHILQKVCMHTGLVLRGPEIRAELNGAVIKELRDAVGAEAIDFVFKTAPLIGAPPEFIFDADTGDIRLDLIALGAAYAVHPEAANDNAYTARLLFKLPQKLSKAFHACLRTGDVFERTDTLPPITRRVIKEVAPQWLPLFN